MSGYPDYETEQFTTDTAKHEMTVKRDDGLYRHLLFMRPDRSTYWFELVTWPGCLAIRGDMDGFVFSRIEDMFEFFRGDRINPGYWSEKIISEGTRRGTMAYSEADFRQSVSDWAAQLAEEYPGIVEAVEEEIFGEDIWHEQGAMQAVAEFEYKGARYGAYGESFNDYTYQFLWCCHAIQWGIAQYDKARAEVKP
jgi:hypothetical protein